jgi:hypothetical protein
MNDHLQNVTRSIRETIFHSPTSFSCLGQVSPALAPRVKRAMTRETARSYLLHQLKSRLYSDFYIHGGFSSSTSGGATGGVDPVVFVEALSAANAGTGRHESGLEVVSTNPGGTVVCRAGLKLMAQPDDCIVEGGGSPQTGGVVGLRLPKELLSASPGYYMTLSNRGEISGETPAIIRIYWNLRVGGAEPFICILTRLLNDVKVYFQLKVLNDPSSYMRCDAGVLYFLKADRGLVAEILSEAYPKLVSHLKPAVPMFTKFLAPGIGLAEDPGNQESFGQHRCRILAEGMVRAYEQGAHSLDERLGITVESFASARISMNFPYLNPNSVDDYAFEKFGAA